MASWLKVAEDLLEVVDRRAKSVATELSDEQPSSQPSGSSGQEGQAKRGKSSEKGPLKLTTVDASKKTVAQKERKNRQPPRERIKIEKIKPSPGGDSSNVVAIASASEPEVISIDFKGANDEGTSDKAENTTVDLKNDRGVNAIDGVVEVQSLEKNPEDAGPVMDGVADSGHLESASESSVPSVPDEKSEPSSSNQATEIAPAVSLDEKDMSVAVIQERNISEIPDIQGSGKLQESMKDNLSGSPEIIENQQEDKSDSVPVKDQDQLEEAQGLLKSAAKTGQSKEARLARVCAGLSSRLQEYKSENAQLEELLVHEREKCSSYEAHIKQLQQELSVSKVQGSRVESNMVDALTAKNSEIEFLAKSLDSWKKKAAASEEMLASLQEDMDGLKRNRELTETRIIQALREELATVERRAEEERISHNATKMAAVEREVELEHRAVEASNALARIQRAADQSSSRAMEFEHKVAVLEVECASLHQELQEMEARNRRAQKKPSEEANQVLQIQAWQEEVERARQSQREAESNISSLEAELQKMRVEMAGMRRDAEHYSRQEHVELEKRYRELTDLLYHKQTQLESMASEKGALEFQLEKSLKQFHEVQKQKGAGFLADQHRLGKKILISMR
ncbi:golgin-84 isoform X2 [Brachypodium distachyon]|uniref:golgin-84 isoform X2 n=1 Tax=Brachypodium distachyon TaxID=15368 RepID=UPI00052FEF69|nr:golgin-84 isoform X2 [Brachypodium distachyon]|eukprot:XP_010232312.1 golgin-84 isoform X2 [Brachypodium distachyon]